MTRRSWLLAGLIGCGEAPPDNSAKPFASPRDTATDTAPDGGFGPVAVNPDGKPPALLSETQLLRWTGTGFEMNERVVPYSVSTPLFSDMALKHRTIWVPEGSTIGYTPEGVLDFPVGTVISKSFLFPADFRSPQDDLRLIETRLLSRGTEEWSGWPYIWDAAGTDAVLDVTGEVREIAFVDQHGTDTVSNYLIPQRNQCVECHEIRQTDGTREMALIGPKARWLNQEYDYPDGPANQLQHLADLGMLSGMPTLEDVPTATDFEAVASEIQEAGVEALDPDTRDRAARDYLDANCAHCHNPGAVEGVSSQLWLNHDAEDLFHLGVCKRPSSAGEGTGGLVYDIVPGDPDASILWYRTSTIDVGAMMPQIGRSLHDEIGSTLIAAWITHLDAPGCSE